MRTWRHCFSWVYVTVAHHPVQSDAATWPVKSVSASAGPVEAKTARPATPMLTSGERCSR